MKDHNYYDTFIAVADDSTCETAKIPQPRGSAKTVPQMQFEMLHDNPFRFTQEDVLFTVWLDRQDQSDLTADEIQASREAFFSKGQACLRTSALAKTHGWGFIFDQEGKVALCPVESNDYRRHLQNEGLEQLKAMRSKRARKPS